MNVRKFFTPLNIVDIEDSGNNGIIYKALEYGRTRALKVMYGFGTDIDILIGKAINEHAIAKELNGINGLPTTHKLYTGKNGGAHEFTCEGFNFQKAKQQVLKNRDSFQADTESELLFAGAFTMDYLDFFSKLPKEYTTIPYELPHTFFEQLTHIANEMLKRGYSLPPESDIGFNKNLEPLVVDFPGCKNINQLISSGMSKNAATNYIKNYNQLKIATLQDYYGKK